MLRQRLQQLAERHDVALVIVDHVYLLRLSAESTRDGDLWQDMYDMSRGLRTLTHALNIPVIAVAPLSHTIEILHQRTRHRSGIPNQPPEAGTEHIILLQRDRSLPGEQTSTRL